MAFIDDIISGIGLELSPERLSEAEALGEDEKQIYAILKNSGEVTSDFIAGKLEKTVSEVNAVVSIMEIKGFLVTSMGKIFIAK